MESKPKMICINILKGLSQSCIVIGTFLSPPFLTYILYFPTINMYHSCIFKRMLFLL